jgi:Tol biopolymer transport system component
VKTSALGTIRLLALQLAALLLVGIAAAAPAEAQEAGVIVYEQYEGFGTNHSSDIWMMNPDGTGQTNLTNTPDYQEYDPELSPDGSEVAFISNRPETGNLDGNYEIFTLTIADGTVTQVTDTVQDSPGDFFASHEPTWSPDGTKIAFSGYRQWGSSEIFTINADGSGGEIKLTDPADFAQKWEPDWSPDGSKIVYTWGWDEYAQDLHVINADGTGDTNLTPEANPEYPTSQRNPAWSPDGTRIAFRDDSNCCGIYPNVNAEIYVMEYPSGELTRVTFDATIDEEPAWSPDGSQIIFTSLRDGGYDLYVVDAPPVPASVAQAGMFSFLASAAVAEEGEPQPLNTATGDQSGAFWGAGSTAPVMHQLSVNRAGSGRGRVTSSPAGIDCGTDCSQAFSDGTSVTLTARAASGSTFTGWSEACTGTQTTCSVTVDAARSVTATFGTSSTATGPTLTVSKAGTGNGKVTSSPAGISCGTDCSEPYTSGTPVTLTAKAGRGSTFEGWGGACSGTASTCTVTVRRGDVQVTATFTLL